MSLINEIAIFLTAAVIFVSLSKRCGLGSVLGYLAAGIVIGPSMFGWIADVDQVLHFAEFGVVFLMFIIGLELQPNRLWTLRKAIFVNGGLQLICTTIPFAIIALIFGMPVITALIIGLVLSSSSTALALQILTERRQLTTRHGRLAFSILLFQDITAAPLLAIIPLFGQQHVMQTSGFLWLMLAKIIGIFIVVIFFGRFILNRLMYLVTRTHERDIFTALALLVVIATAILMESANISMALGAFLAGVILAESEYRHELEAVVSPFKGLLLGLFFISVGMSLNLHLLFTKPLILLGLVLLLFAVKMTVLYSIGRFNQLSHQAAMELAISIAQGGEFVFVLLSVTVAAGIIAPSKADLLIMAVTLSMVFTPVLLVLHQYMFTHSADTSDDHSADDIHEENQVIITGFGRFGQMIGRVLKARGIPITAIDNDSKHINLLKQFGNQVYYGDSSRLELLKAAKADQALVLILAQDDVESINKTAEVARKNFPNLKIYARAKNRQHAYQLIDLDVDIIERELFAGSLFIAKKVLMELGLSSYESDRIIELFKDHDIKRLYEHKDHKDDMEKLIDLTKTANKEFEQLLKEDAEIDYR